MGTEILERHFAAIGARINVLGPQRGAPQIDVASNCFDVRFSGGGRPTELAVIDIDRPRRHLLLLAREGVEKSKFLCGFDERHWFVVAVPECARNVTGVASAKRSEEHTSELQSHSDLVCRLLLEKKKKKRKKNYMKKKKKKKKKG